MIPFDALKHSWLFRGLPAHQVRWLLEITPFSTPSYEKNEAVFHPLETADRIGVILLGKVQSYKLFPNGNQINVTIRTAGDIIGPAAALSVQGRYPFGVVALEHTEVLMFRRDSFLGLLRKDPRLAENVLAEISTITFMLQQRLELLSYHGIDQKIAFYLLMAARESGRRVIPIPGSMTKWALLMNVSRPSLYRELKKLDEQGLLRFAPSDLEILDVSALEKLLSK